MPYIGNQGSIAGFVNQPSKQDLTGASGATLTLTHAVSSAEDISLFINNVRQEPTTSYTVANTTVTLQGYTVSASDDIYVLYNGLTQLSSVPADGSVSDAKISAMSASKLTGSLSSTIMPTGSVLQVVSHVEDGLTYYTYASNTDELLIASNANDSTSHVSVSITPSATTSKILLQASLFYESNNVNNHELLWAFHRDSTRLGAATTGSRRGGIAINAAGYPAQDASSTPDSVNMLFVDSPSSTSAITYAVGFNASHAANLYLNRTVTDNNDIAQERGVCCIVAMEIAG
jgi:hypothetical protein